MQTDILIIGGGLAGLRLAAQLAAHGRDFVLVEAQDRLGGRILTQTFGAGYFDLGPAWFWPGQPRIAALTAELQLATFAQYAQGAVMVEDDRGQVQRGFGPASMQGSYRLEGGLGALIQALAERLPPERLRLSSPVVALTKGDAGMTAAIDGGSPITAHRVVLALPPRVALRIAYTPALPDPASQAMAGIATWMAGQAKAVAVYARPFWRDAGLSGDAMSRSGPMVEMHDASPAQGGPFALFGFIGVPPQARADEQTLRQQLQMQLVRLFGPDAADPQALFLKDWAFDPNTATELDQQPLYAHPQYGMPPALKGLWGGALMFGGTEVAPRFGGYLEGALEAADTTLSMLDPLAA